MLQQSPHSVPVLVPVGVWVYILGDPHRVQLEERYNNPLTLCTVPVLVPVGVWVYLLGDPQRVQLRNATIILSPCALCLYL